MESKDLEKEFTETAALFSKFYLEQKKSIKNRKEQASREMFSEISDFIISTNKKNSDIKIKDLKRFLQSRIQQSEEKIKKMNN